MERNESSTDVERRNQHLRAPSYKHDEINRAVYISVCQFMFAFISNQYDPTRNSRKHFNCLMSNLHLTRQFNPWFYLHTFPTEDH